MIEPQSSAETCATFDTTKIAFSERTSDGIGLVTITGLVFPRHGNFDPLGKIWASVRKRLYQESGVDTTGLFTYDNEQELITCNFLLNAGVLKGDSKEELEAYQKKFEETFPNHARRFEKVIVAFLKARHNGYADYLALISDNSITSEERAEKINELFNAFLKSVRMKGSSNKSSKDTKSKAKSDKAKKKS